MTKLIELKLSKIKYTGDSIGDDIRIEIDCLNHSLDVNKTIKNESAVTVGLPVGQFFTDEPSLALPLAIKVIERDVAWNDVGTAEERFIIDVKKSGSQLLTSIIEVQETRPYKTKKKAIFELTFEASVLDAVMYVSLEKGIGGWTKALSESTAEGEISLPAYLKVRLEKEKNNRQYFTILEGLRRGEKASVMMGSDGSSFLQTENPHIAPMHFTYSLSTRMLRLKKQRYTTIDYKNDPDPWKKQLYTIAIPDSPHKGGEAYLDRAKLAKVWFKVSHPDNERYLHTGERTAGCITLTEVERWDELCKVLLKARRGDGESIGVVEIVE
ncbi:MAG: hypothetical protein UX89_C0014G0034 [Parcubacteria group bacterium GW2011_GWA2_47_16]|nr:MAG: hypothetical protein UX89_C0014G0034 [Parcubacteria group bacterium GW2011_GWA2_47_16]